MPVQRVVKRVSAKRDVGRLLGTEPLLVSHAMPHLSGSRVSKFLGKLVSSSGKKPVNFEVQGFDGVNQRRAPLATYIKEIEKSALGNAYLMLSEELLGNND